MAAGMSQSLSTFLQTASSDEIKTVIGSLSREDQDKLSEAAGAVPAVATANPLRIGATVPNFDLNTTMGKFRFHDWLLGDESKPWTIFFSHPHDYTPVCTTELGACHMQSERFAKIGVKLIGLSCDSVDDHHGWSQDVLAREGKSGGGSLAFPMIADADRSIVTELGMLDPDEKDSTGVPLPARALVVILGTTVKLTILYPATTGRNIEEIFRVVTSLQMTANNGLATPVNWNYGERVMVGPAIATETAKATFSGFSLEDLPSGKEYLRSVDCPEAGKAPP